MSTFQKALETANVYLDVTTPVRKASAVFFDALRKDGFVPQPDTLSVTVGENVWLHAMASHGHSVTSVEAALNGALVEWDDALNKWTVVFNVVDEAGGTHEGTFRF